MSHIPDEQIKGEILLRVHLLTQKYAGTPQLFEKLHDILLLLLKLKYKNQTQNRNPPPISRRDNIFIAWGFNPRLGGHISIVLKGWRAYFSLPINPAPTLGAPTNRALKYTAINGMSLQDKESVFLHPIIVTIALQSRQ